MGYNPRGPHLLTEINWNKGIDKQVQPSKIWDVFIQTLHNINTHSPPNISGGRLS